MAGWKTESSADPLPSKSEGDAWPHVEAGHWLIVTVRTVSPMENVMVPDRAPPPLVATMKVVTPLPTPLEPEKMEIHGWLAVAVHGKWAVTAI